MIKAQRIEYVKFCNDLRNIDPPPLPKPEYPCTLWETYHRHETLMAHWDRVQNPGLKAVLRVFETIIAQLEARHQVAISVWLRS